MDDNNNNINYIEEYLKYGNIKNGNSTFLEYSEPSLIKELITMKIKELKKHKSDNNKINNNKNNKSENNVKLNNEKMKPFEDINNIRVKHFHTRNNSNNTLISKNYESVYQKKSNKRKRKISRCLSVNNLYYEEYKNSYVDIIKNKNLKDTIYLTRKSNKNSSFDINNYNSCSKLNVSFGFKNKNKNNNIKSLSLIIYNIPKTQKDFQKLLFSILKAENSTSDYLYKNINNYIIKINQKVNCLNELSILFKLWKITKISYVIQKRVLDYILSKKSINIIEIINNEILGLKKYNEILLKYNILSYIKSYEGKLFHNKNYNSKELSKLKNIIKMIKEINGIDIIWNGIKFEWLINEK